MRAGDLVVIVKCPPQPLNVGLIVTLVSRARDGLWLCDGNVTPAPGTKPLGPEIPFKFTFVPEPYLRPINNPGDSARDNAWDWLPAVPTKELA